MQVFRPERRQQPGNNLPADLEVELTLLVFRGLLPTTTIGVFIATGITARLALEYHNAILAMLTVMTFLICTLRMALVLCFSRANPSRLTASSANRWRALYGIGTFLYCCTLSVTTFQSFRLHASEGGWLCSIGIFCVCIAIGSRSGMRPWVMQVCGTVLLGTLALSIARSGLHLRWAAITIVSFFTYQFCYALENQYAVAIEQLRIRRQLRILSEQDVLTGLANRRHFEASLATLCASGVRFAVLFIDLDRFKQVNDTYGHATGDALLIQVGERLTNIVRSSDLLARLGGDEFAILQSPLEVGDASAALARRINQALSLPFHIAGHEVSIGASIGIRVSNCNAADASTLLSNADQALYAVKQAGGGTFSMAGA